MQEKALNWQYFRHVITKVCKTCLILLPHVNYFGLLQLLIPQKPAAYGDNLAIKRLHVLSVWCPYLPFLFITYTCMKIFHFATTSFLFPFLSCCDGKYLRILLLPLTPGSVSLLLF